MNTNDIKNLRLCKKCDRYLPKTKEYFCPRKLDKEGFNLYCKECINKEKREARKEKRKLFDKGGKIDDYNNARKCSKCKTIFPESLEYFGKHKTNKIGLDTYCKLCRRENTLENYKKNKEKWNKTHNKTKEIKKNKITEIKEQSKGCIKCGEKRHYLLDFHHKDPESKTFQISQGTSKGWKKIEEEIKKCVLLCSNCHREFHYFEKIYKYNIEQYINFK